MSFLHLDKQVIAILTYIWFYNWYEIVGRKTIHLVIRAVHDETNAGGDLAEFAEDELIIHEVKKIKYIFLKIQHFVGMPN